MKNVIFLKEGNQSTLLFMSGHLTKICPHGQMYPCQIYFGQMHQHSITIWKVKELKHQAKFLFLTLQGVGLSMMGGMGRRGELNSLA